LSTNNKLQKQFKKQNRQLEFVYLERGNKFSQGTETLNQFQI